MEVLYDLKKCLEELAFAGVHDNTIMIQKVKNILEQMEKYEATSPVIGRIVHLLMLLCDDHNDTHEHKGLLLLKTLELVNAVIYTQGFTGIDGEFVPLKKGFGDSIDVPYCCIESMILAMTSDNRCNRDNELSECFYNSPEMFNDYRMRKYIVSGLADLYKPVYLIIQKVIVDIIGDGIIPAIDEMYHQDARPFVRKRLIETVGRIQSDKSNQWLKRRLSEKISNPFRAEVITALSAFGQNQKFLIELAKKEKGRALKAVIEGLKVDNPDAVNVLKEVCLNNNPEDINSLIVAKISCYYKDKENDWYLKILKKASEFNLKKSLSGIKHAIIRALGYSEDNVDTLVALANDKHEPCRDDVLSELLYFDSDNALEVWKRELKTSDDGFRKLYDILRSKSDPLDKRGERVRPLLSRLYESIKKYGTNPMDPYPIYIMFELPVTKDVIPRMETNKLFNSSNRAKPSSDQKTDDMYHKLQGVAGGKVFGALKSIFNHKGTLDIANTVLNKVNSSRIDSERGQAILSVAQKFISDQNDSYQRSVVEKYQFVVDPNDPWSWCLSQLVTAKDERLKVILKRIMAHTGEQSSTDALVHSIHMIHPGIERRHVLLSVLLYMRTQKAKDYWHEEIESGGESMSRLNIILRNVSNGRFYNAYFGERNLAVVPLAEELLSDRRFRFL